MDTDSPGCSARIANMPAKAVEDNEGNVMLALDTPVCPTRAGCGAIPTMGGMTMFSSEAVVGNEKAGL